MLQAGIDIGSRATKLVVLEEGRRAATRVVETGGDPLGVLAALVAEVRADRFTATGYGRTLFTRRFGGATVTEIEAVARGVTATLPGTRAVLDVGGQDVKAVLLDRAGRVERFAFSDRCAGGGGRMLERTAAALGRTRDELVALALTADHAEPIGELCAVYAESEVVALLAEGCPPAAIALGLHRALAGRILAQAGALFPEHEPLVVVGGGSLNPCLVRELAARWTAPVNALPDGLFAAALGAALG